MRSSSCPTRPPSSRQAGRRNDVGGDQAARESRRLGILMVAPAVALTAALIVYPLVKGFITSLQSGDASYGASPNFVGLDNYRQVLKTSTAVDAVLHTLSY